MNIWEAFDELNSLKEAYIFHGDYKSPYLNVSDADRNAAQQQWQLYSTTKLMPTATKGWVRPGLLDARLGAEIKYILDYDIFHRAYDSDLNKYGLLNMFVADGTLGPKGCYGNLKESSLSTKDPLYHVVIELWRWVHSDDMKIKRANTIDKATADKLLAKAKADYDKWQAAKKEKEEKEAKEKAEIKAAEDRRDKLVDILPEALALVDPDLLDKLEETGSTGIDIGHIQKNNYLLINKFGQVIIPDKPLEEYTPEFLANCITNELNKLDLDTQVQMHYLGLDLVKQGNIEHSTAMVAYWVHEGTGEIYVPASKYTKLVNKETKAVASPQDLSQCTLAFIKVSNIGRAQTSSATEDVDSYFYYSYNSDLVETTDLAKFAPKEKSRPLYSQDLTYYQDFEDVRSHNFYNYPGFDTWVLESETEYGNG